MEPFRITLSCATCEKRETSVVIASSMCRYRENRFNPLSEDENRPCENWSPGKDLVRIWIAREEIRQADKVAAMEEIK